MSKPIAVVFCPGRGSYGREELSFIAKHRRPGAVADALDEADAARSSGETITDLDAAKQFRPGVHLNGVNAAELIYFSTLLHLEQLRERYEIVAVAGNSMGWYTSLAASGALDPRKGWRLIRSMAELQLQIQGGQILTTTVTESWQPDLAAQQELGVALTATNAKGSDYFVAPSILLGGHQVIGGTDLGISELLKILPKRSIGGREFPFQLAGNGPFHTNLCQDTSKAAQDRLASLRLNPPEVHLIDGLGNIHTPWSASPARLLDYTTRRQVLETYNFTASVQTAIREFNPDVLLCAGPGQSLRAPVGHVVLSEQYRGLKTREALFESDLVRID
jgi:malonyl CoA-acyl carrier protein transacylase